MHMSAARTFQDLIVWQKSHQFVLQVYRQSTEFPRSEIYGLRARSRITSHFWAPIHPVWRRYSSVEYCRYAPSSRLASRAPRRPQECELILDRTLTQQLRRAAVSIPANIAEGFKKRGRTDKARFMNIAQGSLEETRYYLILAMDLGYLDSQKLLNDLEEIGRILGAYSRTLRSPAS